ncbi:DEAD/DEAH box helicase family protein [Mesobacillus foraminis]|uniref:DEAD/DEAH box helicase family protein n=1 Tax=Mesobacillus foraminis TaxID=279826 RepID=UPI0039A3EDE1
MSKVELITQNLGQHLLKQMESASTICILTSFVMKSGVEFIKQELKAAAKRGADVKICTGDYLYITQPEALRELLVIDPNIEIRLWRTDGVSFHPKAYLFQTEKKEQLFIGSSNLSRSALSGGVEWNLSVSNDKDVFNEAMDQFMTLFYADQTVPLNIEIINQYLSDYESYHRTNPDLIRSLSDREEVDLMLALGHEDNSVSNEVHESSIEYGEILPRFAQIEALGELDRVMEEEYSKALVVMATGLGKTYLAGFFAKKFKRTLFIAHREEILHQARNSFEKIMPEKTFGIYNGKQKEADADVIFASIYTLSLKTHIERFASDHFDLIIVDEFHHAAANSYQRVLDYFTPEFLLGITATPDRNDNKDVYAICDGNVAFRLDFLEAIERQWLSPFKYYGVYDDTDYSQIRWLGNRYDEEELLRAQLREELASKILSTWLDKRQTRTIGFCSSIKQADFLSHHFNRNGFNTISLHSQQVGVSRGTAIKQLEKGQLDVIFTVDLFNEGVDIPPVDTLLFVRPTESLTVFTQQIGRGLRIYPGKKYCTVIDLIGNYRNADIKLSLFDTGVKESNYNFVEPTVPELCEINLDVQVINLIKEMRRKRHPRREKLLNDYQVLKKEIGRRPTYLELHLKGGSPSVHYRQEFHSYTGFLKWAEELTAHELEIYHRFHEWLEDAEKTSMTKSYKMVVLSAMLKRGPSNWYKPITPNEVAPFFHDYLMEKEYRKQIDFSDKSSKKLWEFDEEKVSKLIASMPMTKWTGKFASFENGEFFFNLDIRQEDEGILFNWTKEICEFRLHAHFERKAK